MRNAVFIILSLIGLNCWGSTIDSLNNLLQNAPDEEKILIYQELIQAYQDIDFSKSMTLSQEALDFAEKNENEHWKAKIFISLGNVYHRKSAFDKSIDAYEKAVDKLIAADDSVNLLTVYNNLGTTYTDKGEYVKSIAMLFKGLKLAEELGDQQQMARLYNNIGINYYHQQEFETALEYYNKALEIRENLNDKQGVALAFNNIGIIYYFLGDLETVVDYFHKALAIYQELGDTRGQSLPLFNIAEIYYEQKRYDDALIYYNKSLEIDKKVGDKASVAMGYYSIGNVYVAQKNFTKAIKIQKSAIAIAKEIKANPILKEGYLHLSNTFEKTGSFEEALKYFKLYSAIKDSIFNAETAAKMETIKSKYENEKKQEQIELLEKEQAIKILEIKRNEEKIKTQRILLLAAFLGLIAIVIFVLVLARQIQQKQKINNLLSDKNKQLDIQNKQLENANFEIQKAAKEKEKFFANTSHELRNPLNVVIGFTNLLLKTELADKQKRYLNNIKKSGSSLLVVINDLLTHSKIEAGKLKLEYIAFDLFKEVEKQIEFAREKAFQKNITITSSIPQDIPQYIIGDPVRFAQILGNLLNNAVKFTDYKGKIIVGIKLIQMQKDIANIEFSVKDNGIGIESNKLKEIFESFTQANYDTTRKFGGTGLGLSIVKSLIELQGGKISVTSELQKGSTFTFNLKLKTCANLSEQDETEEKGTRNLKSALRILIVEDDPVNVTLAIDTFQMFDSNIDIDSALNGKIAIEKLQLKDYDLIVMDIQMPVMDGYQTTKHIRNKLPYPKNSIPILGMSAYAMKEEIDMCYAYGMNDYITKPFSPEDLLNKLTNITNKDFKQEKKKVEITDQRLKMYPISLVQIYGNNKEKIDKILNTYLVEIPKKLNALSNASNEHDITVAKSIAHSLKTSFKLIGSSEAASICLKIEKDELDDDELQKLSERLQIVWDRKKVQLAELIATKKPSRDEMA